MMTIIKKNLTEVKSFPLICNVCHQLVVGVDLCPTRIKSHHTLLTTLYLALIKGTLSKMTGTKYRLSHLILTIKCYLHFRREVSGMISHLSMPLERNSTRMI
jgi:hypothetical protein